MSRVARNRSRPDPSLPPTDASGGPPTRPTNDDEGTCGASVDIAFKPRDRPRSERHELSRHCLTDGAAECLPGKWRRASHHVRPDGRADSVPSFDHRAAAVPATEEDRARRQPGPLCSNVGLALTMVMSGVLAALSVKQVSERWSGFGEFARKAPYFSGAMILLVGVYVGCQGLRALV